MAHSEYLWCTEMMGSGGSSSLLGSGANDSQVREPTCSHATCHHITVTNTSIFNWSLITNNTTEQGDVSIFCVLCSLDFCRGNAMFAL